MFDHTELVERAFELMRRIEDHYTFKESEGHHLANCGEWLDLKDCFQHLTDKPEKDIT